MNLSDHNNTCAYRSIRKNPYMTDYTRKNSTHTVMDPNLTVSTLNRKTKVKTALEALWEGDLLQVKSTSTGVYVWKPLKLDYTRKPVNIKQLLQWEKSNRTARTPWVRTLIEETQGVKPNLEHQSWFSQTRITIEKPETNTFTGYWSETNLNYLPDLEETRSKTCTRTRSIPSQKPNAPEWRNPNAQMETWDSTVNLSENICDTSKNL